MSSETVGLVGIIVLLVLLAARMWVGTAMAIVGFFGITYIRGIDQALTLTGMIPYQNIVYYPITVVPMFVLMGAVIANSRMGSDLYEVAYKWLGHLKGGLASATVVASGLLGSVTGSHMSGVIIMSRVALPEMRKRQYDDKLSTASIAVGSPLGILIPPSLAFILYGILTEQSIGKLFMAGVIPGLMTIVAFIFTVFIICRISPQMGPAGPKASIKEKVASLIKTLPMAILFILIASRNSKGENTTKW
jgi:tripartite ATP-independent transporter DctM subunit